MQLRLKPHFSIVISLHGGIFWQEYFERKVERVEHATVSEDIILTFPPQVNALNSIIYVQSLLIESQLIFKENTVYTV